MCMYERKRFYAFIILFTLSSIHYLTLYSMIVHVFVHVCMYVYECMCVDIIMIIL